MAKQRIPMQVGIYFEKRLKDLQKKIMRKEGKKISLRELSDNIVKSSDFNRIESSILNKGDMNFDIKINLDRRKR